MTGMRELDSLGGLDTGQSLKGWIVVDSCQKLKGWIFSRARMAGFLAIFTVARWAEVFW
jgi:hypothetical protein